MYADPLKMGYFAYTTGFAFNMPDYVHFIDGMAKTTL
jgi:hypothetical protein